MKKNILLLIFPFLLLANENNITIEEYGIENKKEMFSEKIKEEFEKLYKKLTKEEEKEKVSFTIPYYKYTLYIIQKDLEDNDSLESFKKLLLSSIQHEDFLNRLRQKDIINLNKYKIKTPFQEFDFESQSDFFNNEIKIKIKLISEDLLEFDFKYQQNKPQLIKRKYTINKLSNIFNNNKNILKAYQDINYNYNYNLYLNEGLNDILDSFSGLNKPIYGTKEVIEETFIKSEIEQFKNIKKYQIGKNVLLEEIISCNKKCEVLFVLLKIEKI